MCVSWRAHCSERRPALRDHMLSLCSTQQQPRGYHGRGGLTPSPGPPPHCRRLLALLPVPCRPRFEPTAHPTSLCPECQNFHGFNCNGMSHNCVQRRCSEMLSNLSFQGNSVFLHGMSFVPPNPKGRETRSQGLS